MAADLHSVRGQARSGESLLWVAPLRGLPTPQDDLAILRSGPGWPDAGQMVVNGVVNPSEVEAAEVQFETVLPRRYGDTGAVRGEGLWANGTWMPSPRHPSPRRWHVGLTIPADVVAVLNGTVSGPFPAPTTVTWEGLADRLSLAVLPVKRTPISRLDIGNGTVTFVGKAAQRPNVQANVRALVDQAWPWPDPPHLVVVTDHDRTRLATFGPGVVYLSDRAFRLSPGLSRFHGPAVRRALYAAGAPRHLSNWDAVFLSTLAAEDQPAPNVARALGWAAWNPIVDALLTDGTLPFYGDTFNLAHPDASDPLLALSSRREPRAAALQALDTLSAASLAELAARTLAGPPTTLQEAALALGLDPVVVDSWGQAEDAEQNYSVVHQADRAIEIRRDGGCTPEPVIVEVDGVAATWLAPPSPSALALPEVVGTVVVDPEAHMRDDDRSDNRSPARWIPVVTGWIDEISPSQDSFVAWANVILRRQDDTRNLFFVGAHHNAQDLFSANVGYVRTLGSLVNRRARTQRLTLTGGPSVLDPGYRTTEAGAVVLGVNAGYTFDSRSNTTYAMHGRRLSLGIGGGSLLGTDLSWASAGATWVELIPLHPRHVLASRLRAGVSSGTLEHRLLPLGGADGVRAASEGDALGNERVVANLEYRWSPVRDASLPLPLAWLSEVQLVPGLEAGVVRRDDDRSFRSAVGADLGVYGVLDVFGARPTLVGGVIAFPIDRPPPFEPQVYLSFDHTF